MAKDYPLRKEKERRQAPVMPFCLLEENPEMFAVFYEALGHMPVPGKREEEKDPLDWVYRNPRKS